MDRKPALMSVVSIALLTLVPQVASAFCGTYVGSPGSEATNAGSRIVIARDGQDTVLTMANDYSGDLSEFGMLIPVPATLSLNDVSVVPPAAINALDEYTGPRLVSYSQEQVESGAVNQNSNVRWVDGEQPAAATTSSGCGPSSSSSAPSDSGYQTTTTTTTTTTDYWTDIGDESFDAVVLEEVSTVGAYDLTLLSADDGDSLALWATNRGLDIKPETAAVLDAYIDGGAWFVAAEVSLDAQNLDFRWLPPLQMRYTSAMVSLPIRLGTTSSAGVQEMLIFTLNHQNEGWTGISNYSEAPIQSECLYDGTNFGSFYRDRAHDALAPEVTGVFDDTADTAAPVEDVKATWLVEYGWSSGKCDPCTDESDIGLEEDTVTDLGWEHTVNDIYVTRIRMRFGPEEIDQDLVLYSSYIPFNSQLRYIQHADYLIDLFPSCEDGLRRARLAPGVGGLAPLVPVGTLAGLSFFFGLRRFRRRD